MLLQRLARSLVRSPQNRRIYSAAVLGIDTTLFAQQETLHHTQEMFKDQVRNNFYETRLSNILIDDIDKFVSLSVCGDDLELARQLIGEAAGDALLRVLEPDLVKEIFSNFNQACHLQNNPHEAMQAWKDPLLKNDLMEISWQTNELYKSSLIFLDLLLENGLYEELLVMFCLHQDHLLQSSRPTLLAILACYKLGTKEALSSSIQYLSTYARNQKGKLKLQRVYERMVVATALLAYNLEEYALAYTVLQKFAIQNFKTKSNNKYGGGSLLVNSLQMMVLARSGRLEEAVTMMKENFLRKNNTNAPRRVVCYTAVEAVVAAASKASKQTFAEVMAMVDVIEESADVIEETMEEIVFKFGDSEEKIVKEIEVDDADI